MVTLGMCACASVEPVLILLSKIQVLKHICAEYEIVDNRTARYTLCMRVYVYLFLYLPICLPVCLFSPCLSDVCLSHSVSDCLFF